MNSLAVIRADDYAKVKVALHDLKKYGRMSFVGGPKKLDPGHADEILTTVMCTNLRNPCGASAVVALQDPAGYAIGRLRKIHPPAHIIIVSPRHEIFHELREKMEVLPDLERSMEEDLSDNRLPDICLS